MILALLLGCRGAPEPTPGVVPVPTRNGLYQVVLRLPDPIPLATLFDVEAEVRDRAGAPVENALVQIDARMPQHGHGMATRPVDDPGTCTGDVCVHPGGIYRTRGMKFHMPGDWVVSVSVTGPAGADTVDIPERL